MQAEINSQYRYLVELRRTPDLSGVPLFSQDVTARDLEELVAETFVNGVLGQVLPDDPTEVRCALTPQWRAEPVVAHIDITMTAVRCGTQVTITRPFDSGHWTRIAQAAAVPLREDATVSPTEVLYILLLALPIQHAEARWSLPLESPVIFDQSLAECGVRGLAAGSLTPDRPVLIGQRLVDDAIHRCEQAGSNEAGAAVLGKIVRLAEPLPNTTTRLVTLLSTLVDDPRHEGTSLRLAFSPAALAEAAEIAALRGMHETVQTVYHSHGWSSECAACQRDGTCPLAGATPSLQDYAVLESLVSSKATLMPIAGRAAGVQQQRPILRVFAWRGGQMCPIRWQAYLD